MRRSLSQKERRIMYEAQKGRCALCKGELDPSSMIAEHTHPVALGNTEKPDCLLCRECAHRKTNGTKATTYGSDAHAIAKPKRLARKEAGTWRRPRARIASRPFPERPEGMKHRWPKRKVRQ